MCPCKGRAVLTTRKGQRHSVRRVGEETAPAVVAGQAGDSLEGNAEAPPRPGGRGLTTRSANFSTRWQTDALKHLPIYRVLSTKGSVYLLTRYQVI